MDWDSSSVSSSPPMSDTSTVPTPTCSTPVRLAHNELNAMLSRYDMKEDDLVDIRDFLVDVARTGGGMMRRADPTVDSSNTKSNTSDRVTETDKAVEEMVQTRLHEAYPAIDFIGEEGSARKALTDQPTFFCDPIDGTLNFIHGFPNTAVSLALTIDKEPVVGVVYNPFRDDLYTAVRGQGSYLTTGDNAPRRLPLRSPKPLAALSECLVAIEWGNQRKGSNWDLRTSMALTLMSSQDIGGAMAHSVRSNGSAALDFCYVAAGTLDLFWEGGCWIWDVCAGWAILEEAGGMVASANPNDYNPTLEGRLYLAVRAAENGEEGQRAVVEELWRHMGDRRFQYPEKT